MPRADNSDRRVQQLFGLLPRKPGENEPVDLCTDCWDDIMDGDLNFMDVDHPPYEDGVDYYCTNCGQLLTEDDDS